MTYQVIYRQVPVPVFDDEDGIEKVGEPFGPPIEDEVPGWALADALLAAEKLAHTKGQALGITLAIEELIPKCSLD